MGNRSGYVEFVSTLPHELIVRIIARNDVDEDVEIVFHSDGLYKRSDTDWRQWRLNDNGTVEWYSVEKQDWQEFDSFRNEYWATIIKDWLADSIILEEL